MLALFWILLHRIVFLQQGVAFSIPAWYECFGRNTSQLESHRTLKISVFSSDLTWIWSRKIDSKDFKPQLDGSNVYPIRSMGRTVYLPTFTINISQMWVNIYKYIIITWILWACLFSVFPNATAWSNSDSYWRLPIAYLQKLCLWLPSGCYFDNFWNQKCNVKPFTLTLPETNIAPENRPSQKESRCELAVSFREAKLQSSFGAQLFFWADLHL